MNPLRGTFMKWTHLENVGVKVSFVLGQALIHVSHLGQRVSESCILRLQLVKQQRELCVTALSLEGKWTSHKRSYTTWQHRKLNLQKLNEHMLSLSYPSKCFRELGSLSLQQMPLNLPLLVSLPHCRQLSTLSGGSTLTLIPLLLSSAKQYTCSTVSIHLGLLMRELGSVCVCAF